MVQSFIPVSSLNEEPYRQVLGFPKATKRQIDSRINELKKIGIGKISFKGNTKLGTLDVLGKGYVGVVVLAKFNSRTVALKIRRTDSPRSSMINEAKLLKTVNKQKVGPKIFGQSKNFLIMEYLAGEKISDWIQAIAGKDSVKKTKSVIKKILEDCYSLDRIGFDHGELSSISKHIIVGKKVTMIDFESSSTRRRTSNVTSATQAIYIGSGIAKKVQRIYKNPSKKEIIKVLRKYKELQNRENFDELLQVLKLK